MKIAIPIVDGQLCLHFGHCAHFALVDVDEKNKQIAAAADAIPACREVADGSVENR